MATSSRSMRDVGNNSSNRTHRTPADPVLLSYSSQAERTRRSRLNARKLSRFNSAGSYSQKREQRIRRKRILMGVGITLASVIAVAAIGIATFMLIINSKLGTNLQGTKINFDSGIYEGVFVEPEEPEDPFWVLLMGTDDRDGYEIPRTDTLILVRVDQRSGTMAMISIPRDTYVEIEGIGPEKINTVFTYAEIEQPDSGPAATVKKVSQFAGVNIAYFAQVNFGGLTQLVDGLGGVEVEVPVSIIGDINAGGIDIYAGTQTLDGARALVFCRSREFPNGDYQRQANQRTFLQALAAKVLASDPATIASTVTNLAEMTYTNMDLGKIIKVAQGMRGLQENAIRTYTVPSVTDDSTGVSYVIPDANAWRQLISAIERGEYPERQNETLGGVVPETYVTDLVSDATGQGSDTAAAPNPGNYEIDVRNGCGIAGSAGRVSDRLTSAGYQQGKVGDAQDNNYLTTLIIYHDNTDKAVADDIRRRLGFGETLASGGDYAFTGDILVVVGRDFNG
jgi:LCP family protein required for cell wall assembly